MLMNFRIDTKTKQDLKEFCRQRERSMAGTIRYAIKKLLGDTGEKE